MIQFPRKVLISPLCATTRCGCARDHDGNEFVENLWFAQDTDVFNNGLRKIQDATSS